ncbi:hypothetical protein EJ02DRAFT_495712 [Clathrospora elynae]|uniref:Uncharacterized protein n=1 Tax=Clathrospora elynae TaxID=706981 RepID=A0A6A5SHC9_9PLEO|nr:hypothetical protein EJ02DRAFT_495712 [Clathrospora elynae]
MSTPKLTTMNEFKLDTMTRQKIKVVHKEIIHVEESLKLQAVPRTILCQRMKVDNKVALPAENNVTYIFKRITIGGRPSKKDIVLENLKFVTKKIPNAEVTMEGKGDSTDLYSIWLRENPPGEESGYENLIKGGAVNDKDDVIKALLQTVKEQISL